MPGSVCGVEATGVTRQAIAAKTNATRFSKRTYSDGNQEDREAGQGLQDQPEEDRWGGKSKTKPDSTTPAKKLSQIAAAEQVLARNDEPMNCKAMVEAMVAQGLWSSPAGKTPHATLYAAILREINTKGDDARFCKTDRGLFALAAK